MHCSICKKDFPSGYSRCPDCMGWLQSKKKPEGPGFNWGEPLDEPEYSTAPSNKQEMLLQILAPRTAAVKRSGPFPRFLYGLLACLALGLTLGGAYVVWERGRAPAVNQSTGPKPDLLAVAEQKLALGQAAYRRKDWVKAQQYGESARDLLVSVGRASPAQVERARQFHRQATARYAKAQLAAAVAKLQAGETGPALSDCRLALALYRRLPQTTRQQAEAVAVEGKIMRRSGDLLAAQSCFEKAHQLDPNGHYKAFFIDVPAPVAVPVGGPTPQVTLSPSLGDGRAYPSGRQAPYRPGPAAGPAPVPVAAVVTKRPPPPAFVPTPKKHNNLHADELPSYNDGK